MIEETPQWLVDLLEKYSEEPAPTLSDDHIADIASSIAAAFAAHRQTPQENVSPPEANRTRELVWRADVRRGLARLSTSEQMAIERAISNLQNPQNEDNLALDYCDAFNEIIVGRHKIFYIIYGTRIEITGLKKVG